MCVYAQPHPTLLPYGLQPTSSSAHGILQARMLEQVAMPFSGGSSRPKDQTHVSCIAGGFLTAEPPRKPVYVHMQYIHVYTTYICTYIVYTCVTYIYIYTHTYSIQWLGEGLIPTKVKQVLLCIIDYAAFIEKDISGEMSIIMLINTGFYNLNLIKHTIRNTFFHHVFNLTPSIITPLRKTSFISAQITI